MRLWATSEGGGCLFWYSFTQIGCWVSLCGKMVRTQIFTWNHDQQLRWVRNALSSTLHPLTITKAHRSQSIFYHKARRLIPTTNPPWVYGFPLDNDFLTDIYGAKFVPMPSGPEPTGKEILNCRGGRTKL